MDRSERDVARRAEAAGGAAESTNATCPKGEKPWDGFESTTKLTAPKGAGRRAGSNLKLEG